MGKATIIQDNGNGAYSIQRNWAGRNLIEAKINAYNTSISELESKLLSMPQTTSDELFAKNIVRLQIAALEKKVEYLTNYMPVDETVDAWCADYTEGLTGEVGTIDIPGEYSADVNIRPGHFDEDEREAEITEIQAEIITAKNDLAAIPTETVEMIAIKSEIAWRTNAWKLMPETTPQEIQAKAYAKKIIDGLSKDYFNLKTDNDYLIAMAERRVKSLEATLVCLQNENIHYCLARDGDLYPGIALGPWTSLLNLMIYPGWQRFKPLHRYGVIIEGTIDHDANTCVVAIRPTYNLMNYNVNISATGTGEREPAAGERVNYSKTKDMNVNYGDTLGEEEIEFIQNGIEVKGYARDFFIQNESLTHPGFLDFVERNPDHPISKVQYVSDPVFITDEQYIQIRRICSSVDAMRYLSDQSGYDIGDYWNVMMDIGDPWYWTPYYGGEPQSEMYIGDKELTYNPTDEIRPQRRARDPEYYFGIDPSEHLDYFIRYNNFRYRNKGILVDYHTRKNLELELAMRQEHAIIMPQARKGDCISVDEEIYTKHGIKNVGDLKVGDIVLSYNFDKQEYCYKPITKIWEKGILPGKRVGLKNGQSIDITENHPLWARTNQTSGRAKYKISHYEKIYFKDINLDQWWKRRLPIAVKIPYEIKDIEWLNEDLCFVLGHYLAEGWKEPSKIQLSGHELTDSIFPLLRKHGIPFSDYKNNNGVPCARVLKCEFKDFLKTVKENSFDIHLPERLFYLPPEKLEKILAGFFLGDGHNGNYSYAYKYTSNKQEVYSTSSKQWAGDIQRLGLQLGRSFHIWEQKEHGGSGNKPIYRITYNPKSHFLRNQGYELISEVGIARKHIEDIGLVKMRDFTVADTHTFIFKNGLICHQCEDFALTKMQAIIEANIIPAESMQILLCYVLNMGYHAVLGIQTQNKGFLISDILYHGGLFRIENMTRHVWSNFSMATNASGEFEWSEPQVILKDVPFSYMKCNSRAFLDEDEVIVEFIDQDWVQPQIIGFRENPVSCGAMRLLPDGTGFSYTGDAAPVEEQQGVFTYYHATEAWTLAGNFPAASTFFACCTGTTGIVYRLGGYTLEDAGLYSVKPGYVDEHWMYDVNLESWQSVQDNGMSVCRQRYKYIGDGKAILYGGEINTDSQYWGDTIIFRPDIFYGDTKKYLFGQNSWVNRTSTHKRSHPASFVIDGWTYIAGGNDTTWPYKPGGHYNDGVYAFSDQYDSWHVVASLPAKFGYACGFGFSDKGYLGGGCEMQRYETAAELPNIFTWNISPSHQPPYDRECSTNIFNYYVCPDIANDEDFPLWWTEGHYHPVIPGRGLCYLDKLIDVKPIFSPPFETLFDEGPPERYVTQTTISGYEGGFVSTVVGLYYDPLQDAWTQGKCHPVYPGYETVYSGFAHSEIDSGKKGITTGGGWNGSQLSWVLDPLTDTWTGGGELAPGLAYSKKFGASGIGISA